MGPNTAHVKSVFGRAMDLTSSAERAAYLEEACGGNARLRGEVESLLKAAQEAPGFFGALAPTRSGAADGAVAERPGAAVGPYKLLEQIGEGGFGVVFMAEQQQPVRRKVALKVLKP